MYGRGNNLNHHLYDCGANCCIIMKLVLQRKCQSTFDLDLECLWILDLVTSYPSLDFFRRLGGTGKPLSNYCCTFQSDSPSSFGIFCDFMTRKLTFPNDMTKWVHLKSDKTIRTEEEEKEESAIFCIAFTSCHFSFRICIYCTYT